MKANKNQLDLFGVNDTPLWSGAPVRVKDSEFIPERKDIEADQYPIPDVYYVVSWCVGSNRCLVRGCFTDIKLAERQMVNVQAMLDGAKGIMFSVGTREELESRGLELLV